MPKILYAFALVLFVVWALAIKVFAQWLLPFLPQEKGGRLIELIGNLLTLLPVGWICSVSIM